MVGVFGPPAIDGLGNAGGFKLMIEDRGPLGLAVFSGMLGVTVFGIFLTPVFFYVIQWFTDRGDKAAPLPNSPAAAPMAHH